MRYPNGQPIRLTTTLKDVNGNLVNATSLTVTVQHPDATQLIYPTPTNDGVGQYHQDLPATDLALNGHYQYVWIATGAGAGVSRGTFDVFDPFEATVLSLQDAKQVVNIPAATTTYDDELQLYVDVATAALESLTGGPAYNRTVTERCEVSGYNDSVFTLRKRPVVVVQSITNIASSQSIPLTDIDLDPVYGTVMRKRELPFWGWAPWYSIVYTAGWGTVIPPVFNLSARIIVQQLWKTQRGPGLAPIPAMEETMLPGMNYAIPNRAIEVLHGTDPNNGLPYLQEVYV